ncbi:MAG TPA: hypothetical protein VF590_25650 [Isosphaeraceae bacterium]
MQGPTPTCWFVGDPDDAWAAAIAAALPGGTRRIPCAGDLPGAWPDGAIPATVVLHRPRIGPSDAESLRRLRARRNPPPRVVLCVGPHARAHQFDRWCGLADVVLPEATAQETVARHVGIPAPAAGPPPAVAVVVADFELRRTLADLLRAAGFPAEPARGWPDAAPELPAVWDVPVLDPDWPSVLSAQAASRAVVTLLGFADRATVGLARAGGAAACLDLPCDADDLTFVLDRLARRPAARRRGEPAHALPPAPAAWRRRPRSVQEQSLSRREVADPRPNS